MKPRTMTAEREAQIRLDRNQHHLNEHLDTLFLELDIEREAHDATKRVSKALAETMKVVQEKIEQYKRLDFYLWLQASHGGQQSDPCKRALEASLHIDAALAQYAASFPEKEINLEPR